MWVYITGTDGSHPEYIISSGGQTGSCNVGVTLQYYAAGYFSCTVKTSSSKYSIPKVNMAVKTWYHLVVTWSPAKGLAIFVNGKLAVEMKTGTSKSVVTDSYSNFTIGTPNNNVLKKATDYYGKCLIDDLIVWEKSLSAETLSELYNTPNYN
jgi:hypothetical protein